MKILEIYAFQILDSRGNPTLEVSLTLEDGSRGIFQVPSGASTGIHEALELRDKEKNLYHGKSVYKAIENINSLKPHLYDRDFNQKSFDEELLKLDGTPNKSNIGANAILGLSIAFARAAAQHYNLPLWEYLSRLQTGVRMSGRKLSNLPENIHLFANVINGGLHSGNGLKIQEFMIIISSGTLSDKVRAIAEIYQTLKELIEHKYGKANTGVGDEGGFAPNISKPKEALDILMKAIEKSGYKETAYLALDCAASDFFDSKKNKYQVERTKSLDYIELTDYYNELISNYPIISIEDPFAEDDFEAFIYFRKNIKKLDFKNPLTGKKEILVVGDDLLVTNPQRIEIAIKKNLCNSLLLKINQIGTLSESLRAFSLAEGNKWHTIVSHRSGETCDPFISDLCIALQTSIKIGAPARGERVAKYNRLLEIFERYGK